MGKYSRAYYLENKKKIEEYTKKWKEINKEKVNELAREYYNKNQEKISTARVSRRNNRKEFLKEYLNSHPCIDCDNSDIRVLEFDHVRGEKIAAISFMVNRGCSLEYLATEIAKCEVRCANCHRIRHYEERL